MIEGRKNVIEWFVKHNLPYWSLYKGKDTSGGNWVDKSSDSETATNSDARRELEQIMSRIHSGSFTLVVSPTPANTSKGKFITEINLSSLEVKETPQVSGVVSNENDIEKRIAAAVDAAMAKVEMDRLKLKVVELEKENKELNENNGFTRLAGIAADLAPTLLPHILGNRVPVAAVAGLNAIPENTTIMNDQETGEDMTADELERLSKVIQVLSSIDPIGWLDKLEKLTAGIEKNPALLDMALKFV